MVNLLKTISNIEYYNYIGLLNNKILFKLKLFGFGGIFVIIFTIIII